MDGILGRKLEMTQMFDEEGRLLPVTLIKAGPCVVTQVKDGDSDGYRAVQIGLVERSSKKKMTKAIKGVCEKAGVAPLKNFAEFRLKNAEEAPEYGSQVLCDIFTVGEKVDIIGKSKGRGFQGVVKRHDFGGGRASHGGDWLRKGGSIGQSAYPARVLKGTRMPGQMGDKRITSKNLRIVHVDAENNLIAVCGAVPGARNSLVRIRRGHGAGKKEG
jgi:large subunit ribosomal protein L3